MKYTVNYRYIASELTPGFLRKSKFISVLYSFIKGLQDLNDVFYNKTQDIYYYLKFNAQIIYLEKYLNDQYDPINKRINISSQNSDINFLFNKIEGTDIFYVYNNWFPGSSYIIGDYIIYNNKIYIALTNNINKEPDLNPSDWSYDSDYVWFYNSQPLSGTYDYIVNVPYVLNAYANKINASVALFNLADKTYKVNLT